MAHLIQPLIDVGDSSPPQGMRRSTRRFPQFTRDAFMPFGYPKHAFNIFLLRDLPDLTVTDSVGKRNGCTFICRFPWGSERVTYPCLRPLYKERRQKVIISHSNPSGFSQSSLLPSGYTLSNNTSTIVVSHE